MWGGVKELCTVHCLCVCVSWGVVVHWPVWPVWLYTAVCNVAYRGRLCEPVCMCSVHWLGESCISCYSMGCVYVWGEGVHSYKHGEVVLCTVHWPVCMCVGVRIIVYSTSV